MRHANNIVKYSLKKRLGSGYPTPLVKLCFFSFIQVKFDKKNNVQILQSFVMVIIMYIGIINTECLNLLTKAR